MLLTTAVNSTEIKAMKTFARMYLCQLKVNTTYERCNEAIEDHKNTAPYIVHVSMQLCSYRDLQACKHYLHGIP